MANEPTKAEIIADNEELQAKLAAAIAEKEALLAENAALQEELESKASAPAPKLPTFTVGKSKYQFTDPTFYLKGVKYKATEAVNDKKVLDKLVQIKAGFIKKV